MIQELKPCPFCGGEEIRLDKNEAGRYHAVCTTCECSFAYDWTKQEAINAWNQRAERTCKPKHWNNASGVAFARGECSECGGYLLENSETGKPRPYCPHCGVKVVE